MISSLSNVIHRRPPPALLSAAYLVFFWWIPSAYTLIIFSTTKNRTLFVYDGFSIAIVRRFIHFFSENCCEIHPHFMKDEADLHFKLLFAVHSLYFSYCVCVCVIMCFFSSDFSVVVDLFAWTDLDANNKVHHLTSTLCSLSGPFLVAHFFPPHFDRMHHFRTKLKCVGGGFLLIVLIVVGFFFFHLLYTLFWLKCNYCRIMGRIIKTCFVSLDSFSIRCVFFKMMWKISKCTIFFAFALCIAKQKKF